ncbi:GNAT family N-acetyltransferase [Paeniglutamicibacter psychrophenolicus]|uniref:GNAT family N-acetyltransferase n=1 Tax=Paeniglutamicibacter psychrophenolicus TaxID=257454 RepID=UPI00278244D9|nr:N-acetyltransferase [Paeniglutamicibacter psychrophenolicus]MDQ0096095.1 putative GNAT family acetyltransferase [Paeniglutamicibacter psychrophenolicus]
MRVIENNQKLRRYQLYEHGDLAGFVQYSMRGEELWLHYTQLKRRYKSEEIVDALFLHILEDVMRRRLALMPFCPAMRTFMVERPQYAGLVPELWQDRFLVRSTVPHRPMDRVRYTGSPKRRSTATHQAEGTRVAVWAGAPAQGQPRTQSAFCNGAPLQGT